MKKRANDYNKGLLNGLAEYAAGPVYPMHMPGHKRNVSLGEEDVLGSESSDVREQKGSDDCNASERSVQGLRQAFFRVYGLDITEITGFDDLHRASGVLKEAMERAAGLYGAKRTWFLVGGSTCGILAAIGSVCKHGDEILIAVNCHISVFHAAQVMGLGVRFIVPAFIQEYGKWADTGYGILGSVSPEEVRVTLSSYPEIRAVVVTSPTYEGIISDVAGIADICHSFGVPLIVDEAHGAHLKFCTVNDAVSAGADLVIHSLHKTLPALTQTALLHIGNSSLVDERRIEEQLSIYETSSPSYLLMASIDVCIRLLSEKGDKLFADYRERLRWFVEKTKGLQNLKVVVYADPSIYAKDPGKILIFTGQAGINGKELARVLLERYQIETEMSTSGYVLAMTSIADTDEGFERLAKALKELDKSNAGLIRENGGSNADLYTILQSKENRLHCLTPAVESPYRIGSYEEAVGKICAEYIYVYPPGIPLTLPGDPVTKELVSYLRSLEEAGENVVKSRSGEKEGIAFSLF
ncbi:MAG: aminotransferase class V-fold PLP-dependent enzyme [Lachnospiraceae bacterium]|nr:aminotransferase class V-fold PLP-dependent enzyme [Lachnospiraceae bacterium]